MTWYGRGGLALWLAVAATHAGAQAVGRPLFQVSDELNYFQIVQIQAFRAVPDEAATRGCIAPPEGRLIDVPVGGGKPLYHATVRSLLIAGCRHLPAGSVFVMVRLVLGTSLVALTWLTWVMARCVRPGESEVPALAAALVATNPVLASVSAGITPDSWANVFSAASILALWRALGGPAWLWLPLSLVTALAAALWKDNGLFLLVGWLVISAGFVLRSVVARQRLLLASLAVLGVGLSGATVFRLVQTPFPGFPDFLIHFRQDPLAMAGDLARRAIEGVPSAWYTWHATLGNFGGSDLAPSVSVVWLAAVTNVVAVAGLVCLVGRGARDATWLAFAGFLLLGCYLQVPVRHMMVFEDGVVQGRWLFPVVGPLATSAAMGFHALGGSGGVRLAMMAGLVTCAVSMQLVFAHYRGPMLSSYIREHLFLRATNGLGDQDALVLAVIQHAAPSPAVVVSVAAALAAMLVVALSASARRDDSRRE